MRDATGPRTSESSAAHTQPRTESLAGREARLALALRGTTRAPDDDTGVRIARLLVTRLRFQRLIHGSARARRWYERDAQAFTRAFRDYCAQVPSRSLDASIEARAFGQWIESASDRER